MTNRPEKYVSRNGMVKRGNSFFARMIVPADVQHLMGKKVLTKALGGDVGDARYKNDKQQKIWKAEIALHRSGGPDVETAVAKLKVSRPRVPAIDTDNSATLVRELVTARRGGQSDLVEEAIREAGLRDTPEVRDALVVALLAMRKADHHVAMVTETAEAAANAQIEAAAFQRREFPEAQIMPLAKSVVMTGVTLRQLYDSFVENNGSRSKSQIIKDDQAVLRLGEFLGGDNVDVGLLTKLKAKEFWTALKKLPARRNGMDMRGLTFQQLIAKGGEPVGNSALYAFRSTLSRMFTYGVDAGMIDLNPITAIKHDFERGKPKADSMWMPDKIGSYFGGPMFTGHNGDAYRLEPGSEVTKDWKYWLPILLLFSGARTGEWAWATKGEVVQIDGVWCLDLRKRPIGDDDGPSVKNEPSQRIIPLHKEVVRLSFVEFVHGDKTGKPSDPVFPDLWTTKKGAAGKASAWFNARRAFDGVTHTLHDFRHTVMGWYRFSHVKPEVHHLLTGHTDGSVSRGYGFHFDVPAMKIAMDELPYPTFPL